MMGSEVSMAEEYYCGIEIGGTKIQCAVGTGAGEIVERVRFGVDLARGADGIRAELSGRIPAVCGSYPVAAVGVGFGGPVDVATGRTITSHQVEGWDDFHLRRWLEELTGVRGVVENDSNCAGWAEYRLGAGRGSRTMVYMNIGSGIGGCFVLEGRLYNGQGFGAAEIGHTRVPRSEGGQDKLENVASGWAFQERLSAAYPMRPGERLTELCGGRRERIDGSLAAQAARAGDASVCEAFRDEAEVVGLALANVITLLCPEVVVVGGGLALAGDVLFDPLEAAVDRSVIDAFRNRFAIRPSRLGDDSVLYGAILLAAEGLSRSEACR
jgi:glucokinase